MAEHCRECRAMRNLGSCDCAELLSRRPIFDPVAKPLLRSALGERWMGMDDVTRPYEHEALVRLRRRRTEIAEAHDAAKENFEGWQHALKEIDARIAEEEKRI